MRPGSPATGLAAWHAAPQALSRFVTDLIADEVAHLRPGGAALPAPPWAPELALDEQGLGLDSLERLAVASALNEALHLHESGVEDLLLARRHFGEWLELAAAALAAFDARLTFRTSGSSGQAKPCTHALAHLEQEVAHLVDLTAGARRVLSAVPAHHIYGFLFTVLLPERHGRLEVIDVRRRTPQALAAMLAPGDLVVSHPAHWSLMARHVERLPAGVHGVTSTAPCPDALACRLDVIGLSQLTQIYGSSETAGIGTKTAADGPFRLMPFWSRDGRDDHALVRAAPDGSTHRHAIGDRLEWADDRRFTVGARVDRAVQVGGVNVFPARVRQMLLEHPLVADAAVRLMAPDEGSRLKAFVVLAPGADRVASESALWRWAEARLAAPERPKSFTLGDRLPVNPLGKLADWPLAVVDPHGAGPAIS
jgi:long-chain acyl-CoA synthetase